MERSIEQRTVRNNVDLLYPIRNNEASTMRDLQWVNERTRKELAAFPPDVQDEITLALRMAQRGEKADCAKPMKGFRGAKVFEIVVDEDGDTFRGIYTVQFADAIWVLHVFQKKSTQRIKTPKHEIDLINQRLKAARLLSQDRLRGNR